MNLNINIFSNIEGKFGEDVRFFSNWGDDVWGVTFGNEAEAYKDRCYSCGRSKNKAAKGDEKCKCCKFDENTVQNSTDEVISFLECCSFIELLKF